MGVIVKILLFSPILCQEAKKEFHRKPDSLFYIQICNIVADRYAGSLAGDPAMMNME